MMLFGPNPRWGVVQTPTLLKLQTARLKPQRVKLISEAGILPKPISFDGKQKHLKPRTLYRMRHINPQSFQALTKLIREA